MFFILSWDWDNYAILVFNFIIFNYRLSISFLCYYVNCFISYWWFCFKFNIFFSCLAMFYLIVWYSYAITFIFYYNLPWNLLIYCFICIQSCLINYDILSILANCNSNLFYGDEGNGNKFLKISVASTYNYYHVLFNIRSDYINYCFNAIFSLFKGSIWP